MEQFWKNIIAAFKKLKDKADASDDEILAELKKVEVPKTEPSMPTNISDPNLKAVIEGLQSQNNALTQQIKDLADALSQERIARENAIKTQQEKIKSDNEKKITDAVDAAIKAGKYPEAKREWLKERFTKDFDGFSEVVKEAAVKKEFMKDTNTDKTRDEGIISPLAAGGNPSILSSVKKFAGIDNSN